FLSILPPIFYLSPSHLVSSITLFTRSLFSLSLYLSSSHHASLFPSLPHPLSLSLTLSLSLSLSLPLSPSLSLSPFPLSPLSPSPALILLLVGKISWVKVSNTDHCCSI